jgi:methionine-rich copper-binding protein CopC
MVISVTQTLRTQKLQLQYGRRASPRALAAWLLAAAFSFAAMLAQAHAIVVSSTPAANASVVAGALDIVVRFNTRIDRARSRLYLEAPGGDASPVAIVEESAPTAIAARGKVEKPGHWKLRWQVLATDGHITRGEIPFLVIRQ